MKISIINIRDLGGGGFAGQSVYMKSFMLRSSRAFLGGGGFLGLWAAPGDICRDISLLVKAASSFIPKYYCFQKSERYRRPRRGPHHGHHGSSRCSRLHRDKRKKRSRIKFLSMCVCCVCAHLWVGGVEATLMGSSSIICQ